MQEPKQDLKQALKNRLKNVSRVAVVGMGSEFRGDDVAGILVVERLEKSLRKTCGPIELQAFNGSTAPENITGDIKRFKPTHVILVDAADVGNLPGEISLIEPSKTGDISFSTHRLPAKIFTKYLQEFLQCEVLIIGIRPKTLEFFKRPSPEIRRSAKFVSDTIQEIMQSE